MPIAKGIGLISSIGYVGTNLEKNFRRGVKNNGQEIWCDAAPPQENQGYDNNMGSLLYQAVDTINNNAAVGLIVTVGGLVSAIAAKKYAAKPFLSLIGGITADFPGTITGNFYGGVDLHTFNDNNDRFNNLTGPPHRFAPGAICLLSNPNSAMAYNETASAMWPTPPRGPVFTAKTEAEIAAAFRTFAGDARYQAMIISADPFFQHHKDALITAGNASDKYVCYPLQIYANTDEPGHPKPTHTKHMKHGPKLGTAYFDLGEMAAAVIKSNNPSTLVPADTEVNEG